ncbi:MAG: hypothetical protein HDQ87_05405 [Clostridia bacterium]|nr:hypothetical protein [Clostridia bacterium]
MESIQIAGTNGKGSTAIYLASILGCGHKTGLFTSPHIRFFEERFVIDGRPIDEKTLGRLTQLETDDGSNPFMTWTRMAKRWLVESGARYAVVETGLGGAKDPTLIFEPEVEILTPISLDHTEILGSTIPEIAREKAGIIRQHTRVFSAPQQPAAMEVIAERCRREKAELTVLQRTDVQLQSRSLRGQVFSLVRPGLRLEDLEIQALSPAQVLNAALASLAASSLGAGAGEIRQGLERAQIHGRVEYLRPGIILDGGHNPDALAELERTLRLYFPDRSFTVLFALMKEKDAAAAAEILERLTDSIYLTRADETRGYPLSELASFFQASVHTVPDPETAFAEAWETAQKRGDILVVCGSFYLVGAVCDQVEQIAQQRLARTLW